VHSGNKYLRTVNGWSADTVDPLNTAPNVQCVIDVYAAIESFAVHCPAVQHALKKLLCAGLRNKNTTLADLTEARDALSRATKMQMVRDENNPTS